MGIKCRIIRNPQTGKIENVEAPNGEQSQLYLDALAITQNEEEALDLWTTSYIDEFKEIYGNSENPLRLQDSARFQQGEGIQTPTEATQQIIDQLQKTGLAENVYQLSSQEIENKLEELGISEELRKQVVAYHGTVRNFSDFLRVTPEEGRYGQVLSGTYFGEGFIAFSFAGGTPFTSPSGRVLKASIDDSSFYTVDMQGTTPSSDQGLINTIGEQEFDKILDLKSKGEIKGLRLENTREFLAGETKPTTQYVVYDNQLVEVLKEYRQEQADVFQPRFQLIGKEAQKGEELNNKLSEAKTLEEQGISMEAIELQTGWFKENGDWKYFDKSLLESYNISEQDYTDLNVEKDLQDVIGEDNNLFTYYPQLKKFKIEFYDNSQDTKLGSTTGEKIRINTSKTLRENNYGQYLRGSSGNIQGDRYEMSILSTFAHEISHVVQDIEGFPEGGTPYTITNKAVEKVGGRKDTLRQQIESIKEAIPTASQEDRVLFEQAVKIIQSLFDTRVMYQKYVLLFGEVEARFLETLKFDGITPNTPYTELKEKFVQNQGIEDKVQTIVRQNKSDRESAIKVIPNGFVINNEVYLNKDTMNETTPIHEFNHLYNSWLRQARPEVYKRGLDLVEAELGKTNSEIQDVINYVKSSQPNLEGEALREEILTELVGRRGLEKITEQKQSGIIEWLKEAWQAIKDMLGISQMTTEQILNLDLQSYADAMAVDLLSGESLNQETIINKSADTQDFFSDVVSGKSQKFKPNKSWESLLSFTEKESNFKAIYDTFKGNFDEHIATSIPTFREAQIKVGAALVDILPKGSLLYDIGGSEGGFVKSITKASKGQVESINLDPNPDMKKVHESSPVEGSAFIQESFYESFEDDGVTYEKHVPENKADVVHESMVFQFITPKRKNFIKEVKDNYLKEDGIFLTEEKLLPNSEEVWRQNEENKNQYKSRYYSQEQLRTKSEEVLVGMKKNQTYKEEYLNILKNNFDYVEEYWDAGNFKGIIATNSKEKLDAFKNSLGGRIESEFSSFDSENIYNNIELLKKVAKTRPILMSSNNTKRLTTDNNGNFVFHHYSKERRPVIKRGLGENIITSREEGSRLSVVGGMAMYYTMEGQKEAGVGNELHTVVLPMDTVYDADVDFLGLREEAKRRLEQRRPGQAFDENYRLALITEIANELGYSMTIANWGGKEVRAQTTLELKPIEENLSFKERQEDIFNVGEVALIRGVKAEITAIDGIMIEYKALDGKSEGSIPNNHLNRQSIIKLEEPLDPIIRLNVFAQAPKFQQQPSPFTDENGEAKIENVLEFLKEQNAMVNTTTVFRGEGNNFAEGSNTAFTWVALSRQTASNYGEVTEMEVALPQNPFKPPYKSNVDVRAENIANLLRQDVYDKIKNNEIDAMKASMLMGEIKSYENLAENTLEKYHTKISKPKASNKIKDILESLGYDGIFIPEGDGTYAIFKESTPQTENLTAQEKITVANILRTKQISSQELSSELNRIFADSKFNKEVLNNSSIFSRAEAIAIQQSEEYIKNLRELSEKEIDVEDNVDFDPSFLILDGTINKYGLYNTKNPFTVEKEIMEQVSDVNTYEEFSNRFNQLDYPDIVNKFNTDEDFAFKMFSKYSQMKKIDNIDSDLNTKAVPNSATETENSMNVAKMSVASINLLQPTSEQVWNESEQSVVKALEQIEKDAEKAGIDFSELSDMYYTKSKEEFNALFDSLKSLKNNTEEATFNAFIDQYKEFFDVEDLDLQSIEEVPIDFRNRVLLRVDDRSLSEYELFEKEGLLKVSEGLYQQIDKVSLDNLYEMVYAEAVTNDNRLLPNRAYFNKNTVDNQRLQDVTNKEEVLNNIKIFIENNVSELNIDSDTYSSEVAQQMLLYKYYFEVPTQIESSIEVREEAINFEQFKGDSFYLSSEFITEFQENKLKSKRTNPEQYDSFYNNFTIDSNGIKLKSNDPITVNQVRENIPAELEAKLKDYSVISRDPSIKSLFKADLEAPSFISLDAFRNFYQNNIEALTPFKGDFQNMSDNRVVTTEYSEPFLRIGNKLYEKADGKSGTYFYEQIPTNNSVFNLIKKQGLINKFAQSDIKAYIRSQENVEKNSNLYTKEELAQINEKYFNCGL